MKGKLLLVAAMVMAVASLGLAQPFQVTAVASIDIDFIDPADFTVNCDGTGGYLPDGEVFYWIDNSTGEPCVVPPYYGNVVTVNGNVELGMPGNFYSGETFGNDNWSASMSFHLEYCGPCVGGYQQCWIGPDWSPAVGPQEVYFAGSSWTCVVRECGEPCVPTGTVDFVPVEPIGQQDMAECIILCEGSETLVCVGPLPQPDRLPVISILPGCEFGPTPCDFDCVPAYVWGYNPAGWVWTDVAGLFYYCNVIYYDGEEGCVCVHLDFIEAVETVDLDVAFDGAVRLNWSETTVADLDKYVISRNGSELASVAADVYSFVDENIEYGMNYTYELAAVDLSGNRTVLATESITPSEGAVKVTEYALHQNYPNPFNPTTTIRFDLVESNFVTLKVYNATGQEVATMSGDFGAGVNFHTFDASNLTSGLYFYTVQIGDVYSATKKMLLVK